MTRAAEEAFATVPAFPEGRAFRVLPPGASVKVPHGARLDPNSNDGLLVALDQVLDDDVAAAVKALPRPTELAPGTLVVVTHPRPSLARRAWDRTLGRRRESSRAVRCSALLVAGYVEVGAGRDRSGLDLTWGTVPKRDEAVTDRLR